MLALATCLQPFAQLPNLSSTQLSANAFAHFRKPTARVVSPSTQTLATVTVFLTAPTQPSHTPSEVKAFAIAPATSARVSAARLLPRSTQTLAHAHATSTLTSASWLSTTQPTRRHRTLTALPALASRRQSEAETTFTF